ncbi:MAG: site-specific integrase, partial [Acidobacteria bacterium]|nr:site-specific integrase [Acidobacteriota bacterium]
MANPLINKFISYVDHERNFSPHTVRCYAADLGHFAAFLGGPGATPDDLAGEAMSDRIRRVTPLDLRGYLAELRRADYSRATVARKIATLRSFYKYLAREDH